MNVDLGDPWEELKGKFQHYVADLVVLKVSRRNIGPKTKRQVIQELLKALPDYLNETLISWCEAGWDLFVQNFDTVFIVLIAILIALLANCAIGTFQQKKTRNHQRVKSDELKKNYFN